jgi:hypothetical protein
VSVDLDDLTRRWRAAWPHCPPVGHLFRYHLRDTWVRFHSLPESRRYADSEADYEIILHRHNTILRELGATEVYVMTAEYDAGDLAAGMEPIHVGLHPNAAKWLRVAEPDEPGLAVDLHISQVRYEPGTLDPLLRYVADDQTNHVVIADTTLRWLYHPYDGGADAILPSSTERDRLKARYAEWLSARPDGT